MDLILDCVGGSFWKQNVKVLAVEGTWINYGLLGGGECNVFYRISTGCMQCSPIDLAAMKMW